MHIGSKIFGLVSHLTAWKFAEIRMRKAPEKPFTDTFRWILNKCRQIFSSVQVEQFYESIFSDVFSCESLLGKFIVNLLFFFSCEKSLTFATTFAEHVAY